MAKVSNCCGVRAWSNGDGTLEDYGLCSKCKDHCEYVEEDAFEQDTMDVDAALDLYGKLGEFFNPKTNQDTLNKITTKIKS